MKNPVTLMVSVKIKPVSIWQSIVCFLKNTVAFCLPIRSQTTACHLMHQWWRTARYLKNVFSGLSGLGLFFLFLSPFLQAQTIYENKVSMSQGINNAFYVEIEGADRKTTENVWKDYIKEFGKAKKDRKSEEWYVEEAFIPAMNNGQPVKVFLRLEEFGGMTRAYIWYDLGFEFINSETFPDETYVAEIFLKNYYRDVRKEIMEKEVNQEREMLENLEKDLNKLIDKNEDIHKEIQEYREKISKAELEIEKNVKEQSEKIAEIERQKLRMNEIIEELNKIGRTR